MLLLAAEAGDLRHYYQTADANQADNVRNPIRQRSQSNQTAYAIQAGGVRNPSGRRTESDQAAYGIRSGGVRRSPTNQYSLSPKIYVPTRTIVERHSAAM